MSEELPEGGWELSPAEIESLDDLWASCFTPQEVAQRLAGIDAPWYVAAGWALDLFRGTQSRHHDDIEIAVPAGRFAEIRDCFPRVRVRRGRQRPDLGESFAGGAGGHVPDVAAGSG
jgi:hypothetical protein